MVRKVEHKHDPPDPNAKCRCGLDDSDSGMRYSIVCPKHDGRYYDIVTEEEESESVNA